MQLQDYLALQQAEQQGQSQPVSPEMMQQQPQQPPQKRNPIQEGANAGLQAARESMELSDVQRQRALGHAMMQFAANMARPPEGGYGPGFGGRMNAVTQSMAPAAEAYAQQMHREQLHNEHIAHEMARQQHYAEQQALQAQRMAQHEHMQRERFAHQKSNDDARLQLMKERGTAAMRLSANPELQTEKHLRLAGKDMMDFKKNRARMIAERMKEVPVYGSKRAEMKKQVEAEVDAELAPIYENIQERLKYKASEHPTNNKRPTVTYKNKPKVLEMEEVVEIPAAQPPADISAPQMSDEEYERLMAVRDQLPD